MVKLDELPVELLARICSYLPVKFVQSNFVFVCRKFHLLFGHEEYWRGRLLNFDPTLRFPASTVSSDRFRWDRTCHVVESEQKRWWKGGAPCRRFTLSDGHIATVDSVHIMQAGRLCISGSHDRCLCVWDLSKLSDRGDCAQSRRANGDCRMYTERKGHDGWIWSITSIDDRVYTGAWDQKILQWELTSTELRQVSSMKCTAAVLCVAVETNAIFASTFDRQVKFFDARDPHNLIATLRYHTGPVLGVTTDGDGRFVYSCSEDKTMVCFDRRASAVLHTLQLSDYGVAVSYNDGQLWMGDTKGKIYLVDTDFRILTHYDCGDGYRVTDLKHNTGCITSLSVSRDRNAQVLVTTAGMKPRPLANFTLSGQEPTKLDYRDGILACGFVDCSVRVWMPDVV